MPLQGRRVLLIVTGGIAACKVPELVRRLREAGGVTALAGVVIVQRWSRERPSAAG
ncbi:hypothetical protein [uncultured Rhodospira sp.]|uniref:hypothetical protein n=1 Tax=uncultured Rhodospira sp. TaxID=1936189 RepID=UPI00260EF2AB|nr:hypothetical protein [uncultured Rhodospira sp.]